METYKIVRRWYTVQLIKADSEEAAVTEAKDAVVTAEDFYEEDYEVELAGQGCPDCRTPLVEGEDDDGKFLYCPNEMCLNNEQKYT